MTKQEPVGKPFAGYDDFDSCVSDNPDKEDPEAFCGWLQDRAKDLADSDADTVLVDLTTEFVSSVDNPAQRSEWVIRKDADVSRRNASEVERPFVLAADDLASKAADVDVRAENSDGDRQIAYAAVLVPDEVDKQGDVVPPYVVERSAHEYLAEYRKMDTDHDLEDGAGTPVESWILKDDTSFETPDGDTVEYPAGTWILGKRFVDSEWKRVQSGELTGFSIYGGGEAIDVDRDVAEGIDELKSMVKGVDSKVDDFDDRLDEVGQEVDALKSAVGDDVPNDRLDDGGVDDDVSNDRMKSVARDAVAEVAGVDSNDPEVVRKALVEQVDSDETPDLAEDYSDVVDDDAATGGNGGGRTIRNKRFAGEN